MTDTDFARAMHFLQRIVSAPDGDLRLSRVVPLNEMRCVARVLIAQQERIVELERGSQLRGESEK